MIYKKLQFNKGYTLLFAVLVSSLVLAVGISILNISKKEFLLSSSARESTVAFYSADSGIECAAYFDNLGTFSPSANFSAGVPCGIYISAPSMTHTVPSTGVDVYTFDMNIAGVADGACASVTVQKTAAQTIILSRGYNHGWNVNDNTCSSASPRRVERALKYHYSTANTP